MCDCRLTGRASLQILASQDKTQTAHAQQYAKLHHQLGEISQRQLIQPNGININHRTRRHVSRVTGVFTKLNSPEPQTVERCHLIANLLTDYSSVYSAIF